MAIDQKRLGEQIAALMEEIENDPEIPSEGSINRVVVIVEVVGKEGDEHSFNLRVNSSASPHVSIGFLEVAKAIQFKTMGLG
jgi:hypothetical protein